MRSGQYEEHDQPQRDRSHTEDMDEWIEEYQLWKEGKHSAQIEGEYVKEGDSYVSYAGGPPDPEYYRPEWNEEEATWYQVYETVSEGTPVTPPFENQSELIDYLVENGDYWDQSRRKEGITNMNCEPWTREQAEKFVYGSGWVPSLVFTGGEVKTGVESLTENAK